MIKRLLCTTVLLFGATALHADVFSFSYTGTVFYMGTTTNVSLSGQITASELSPYTPDLYTISDITGTRSSTTNGITHNWTIYDPPGGGVFTYDNSSNNSGAITFSLSGYSSGLDTVFFSSGVGSDTEIGPNLITSGNFKIGTAATVPEPAVISLLCLMGLGVWFLTRKLPSKNAPLS